jgi:hypothetical protein
VFKRLGKIFLVLALVAMLGAHWAVLQTVAWTTMLADNLCDHSVKEAVTETFDGNHPCDLCKAIAAGKQSEKKTDFSIQSQKLEFPPAKQNFALIAPSQFQLLPLENSFAKTAASAAAQILRLIQFQSGLRRHVGALESGDMSPHSEKIIL